MNTPVPDVYKPIATYVRVANQFKQRDAVLYYWILNYVVERALAISNAADGKQFLLGILSELEELKKSNAGNENYTQGPASQCHVEGKAVNLFKWADEQDRAKNYSKEVIQAYYNAAHLFDVVTLFGEDALDEKTQSARKYAKWRATHIHQAVKQGTEPDPPSADNVDPADDELNRELLNLNVKPQPRSSSSNQTPWAPSGQDARASPGAPHSSFGQSGGGSSSSGWPPQSGGYGSPYAHQPQAPGGFPPSPYQSPAAPQQPQRPPPPQSQQWPHIPTHIDYQNPAVPLPTSASGKEVTLEEFIEARKLTKMAMSALDYEDARTAVDFLRKAISTLEK